MTLVEKCGRMNMRLKTIKKYGEAFGSFLLFVLVSATIVVIIVVYAFLVFCICFVVRSIMLA